MEDQKKASNLGILHFGLAIICLILFLNSATGNFYDFLNRKSLQASLRSTQEQLKKVAVQLDYRRADLSRMGAGANDNLRRETERRITTLEHDKARLMEKRDLEYCKLTTTPKDWQGFLRHELKDLLGSLFFLLHIISAIIDWLKGPTIMIVGTGVGAAGAITATQTSESQDKKIEEGTKLNDDGKTVDTGDG